MNDDQGGRFTIPVRGPFSLAAVRELQCGFLRGSRGCAAGEVKLAFPCDGTFEVVGVPLREEEGAIAGEVVRAAAATAEVARGGEGIVGAVRPAAATGAACGGAHGPAPRRGVAVREPAAITGHRGQTSGKNPTPARGVAAVARQVARVLGLDHDGARFARVLDADPVLRGIAAARPGFRPVVSYSPYVMAGWAVLSQRLRMAQAAAIQVAVAEAAGDVVELDGARIASFPRPQSVLARRAFPGVPDEKCAGCR
jgi:hypothetical protein